MSDKVSVCIPVYNGEKYLRDTLECVINQTYKNLEIIIVDDNSKDQSHSIIDQHAKADKRIRVIRNEVNLGLVGNWNKCILESSGQWVKFVFQDDLITRDHIEIMLAKCVNDGSDLSFCFRDFVFESGTKANDKNYYLRNAEKITDLYKGEAYLSKNKFCSKIIKSGDKSDIYHNNVIGEPTVLFFRKSVFRKYGLFNEQLVQTCDFEFFYRVATNEGITVVPEVLATFRVHSNSTTMSNVHTKWFHALHLEQLTMLNEM